jgi:ferredoxin
MDDVPTIRAAYERGLCPASWKELTVHGDLEALKVPDFDNILTRGSLRFQGNGKGLKRFTGALLGKMLASRPELNSPDCVGCGLCARTCPAKAIEMRRDRPAIDRRKCIHCFCCQEFCPKGALVVRRPPIAWLLDHGAKK